MHKLSPEIGFDQLIHPKPFEKALFFKSLEILLTFFPSDQPIKWRLRQERLKNQY